MREALVRSMNLVSVRLLLFETGIGNAVRHIAKFGFGDAALPRNGSLALGGGTPRRSTWRRATPYRQRRLRVKPYVIDAIYGPTARRCIARIPPSSASLCQAEPDETLT